MFNVVGPIFLLFFTFYFIYEGENVTVDGQKFNFMFYEGLMLVFRARFFYCLMLRRPEIQC